MKLKDIIKEFKLKDSDYLSLYNKDNNRFYGAFVHQDYRLDDYYEMEAEYIKQITKHIHAIKIVAYEHYLGLDSMRLEWSNRDRQKSREKRDLLASRKRGKR